MHRWAAVFVPSFLTLAAACGEGSSPSGSGGITSVTGGNAGANTATGGNSMLGGGGAGGAGGAATSGSAGTAGNAETAGNAGGGAAGAGGGQGGQGSGGKPPEGVPSNYRLVYSQSFADAASLADLVFANPNEWQHDPAGFVASTGATYMPPYRSPFSVAIIKPLKVASFVMDIEMLQTSPDGDAHRDMVLIWNLISPSQFYYAHVSTSHDAVAHNILIVDNADRKAISTMFTTGYDWGRDVWKRLRVVRDTETGSMSVHDLDTPNAPLLTASDDKFSEGYVGFGSFDNSGRVRNVKVWAASSTAGDPNFFAPAK